MLKRLIISIFILYSSISYADKVDFTIKGVSDTDIVENIKKRLTVAVEALGTEFTEEEFAEFYRFSPSNITKAMQPYGYYQPTITSERHQQGDTRVITFNITPGPLLRITALDVRIVGAGKDDAVFNDLLNTLPIAQGQPLLTEAYEKTKRSFFRIADNNGYIRADFSQQEILINLQQYTATVVLHFNTGPKYYFGEVKFSETSFSDDFLHRYIKFQYGDVYSAEQLQTLQETLSGAGYFQRVRITPDPTLPEGDRHVSLFIDLVPAKSQRYTFGIGYSTDVQFRGTVGFDLRRVTDTGHRFQSLLQASAVENNLQAQYIIPGRDPTSEQFTLAASIFNLDYDNLGGQNVTSRAGKLSVGSVKTSDDWQRVITLNYLYESFVLPNQPRNQASLLYPAFSWRFVNSDDLFFPRQGYSLDISTLGASRQLGSNVSLWQITAEGKYIFSLTERTRTLFRGTAGYIDTPNINNVPPSIQFYTGGIQSLRGYEYQSIGPGRFLLIANAELQQRISEKWYISGFYDVGDAFNNSQTAFKHSWGALLVRNTPVGPIKLGFAQALSLNSQPFRLVFSVGPEL